MNAEKPREPSAREKADVNANELREDRPRESRNGRPICMRARATLARATLEKYSRKRTRRHNLYAEKNEQARETRHNQLKSLPQHLDTRGNCFSFHLSAAVRIIKAVLSHVARYDA